MPKPRTFRLEDQAYSYLKTYEKEHKCKSETDALNQLVRDFASLKTQTITSDVPMGEPVDPKKQKAIHELRQEAITPLPPPPCQWCGKGYIDPKTNVQYIFCDNPSRKLKGKKDPMCIALTVCQQCWKRREYVRAKKEREQEEKTNEPEPEPQPKRRLPRIEFKGYLREWDCRKLGKDVAYIKAQELKDKLPCLQDPTFICDIKIPKYFPTEKETMQACRTLLMHKLDLEAPELIQELAKKTIETYKQST